VLTDDTRRRISEAFDHWEDWQADEREGVRPDVDLVLDLLEKGYVRAADGDRWLPDETVKKAILLSFLLAPNRMSCTPPLSPKHFDKVPLKFESWSEHDFVDASVRVVPGAVVRRGAYIGRRVILMPSFVNVGAYVGDGTMVDTWATIGSCAQVGARCHISGGVGIGGVLEPLNARPVVIEDDVFVGARSEIAEGVVVRSGAVIGMGVFLGASTPIVDRGTGEVFFGEVPPNAVVVAGARASDSVAGLSIYAAVIVKYADGRTRTKTALNAMVRPS